MSEFPSLSELSRRLSSSKEPLNVIWSSSSQPEWNPASLVILDSSFNPPSRAHQDLAVKAHAQFGQSPNSELLLLFASQNADKALGETPSIFQKLTMMHLLAQDVLQETNTVISIAVTSEAYFADKARVLHRALPACQLKFIVGWDTVVRFFNPKYYGGEMDAIVGGFFGASHGELLWSRRPASDTGADGQADAERAFLESSVVQQHAQRIHLIERESTGQISSTNARKAAQTGDNAALLANCSKRVAEFVLQNGLYI